MKCVENTILRRVYSTICLRISQADVGQDRRETSFFRFFPEFWKVKKTYSNDLGPKATVQAMFGWDLREFHTFGLPLSPVLQAVSSNYSNLLLVELCPLYLVFLSLT